MSRQRRIHYPGALYYVFLKGNARQDVFFSEEDLDYFCALVEEGLQRFGHRIHAFCLMPNSIHLAVQVEQTPLSRIMQNLSFRYTCWVNQKYGRGGHLFQGRYNATLIDAVADLLKLVGYVHFIPVMDRVVAAPGKFFWSGHDDYLGKNKFPWLTTQQALARLSGDPALVHKFYGELFDGKQVNGAPDLQKALQQQWPMTVSCRALSAPVASGPHAQVRAVSAERVINLVCREYGLSREALLSKTRLRTPTEARAMAAWMVLESDGATLVELGRLTNRDPSSLSSAARRLVLRAEKDRTLASRMKALDTALLG